MNDELICELYSKKQELEKLTEQIKQLQEQAKELDANIESMSEQVLSDIKNAGLKDYEVDNLKVGLFSRSGVQYLDEDNIINIIRNQFDGKYLKIKESLDKTALKKALKTDTALNEAVGNYIGNTTTDYVVVSTKENFQKMLEHMGK